MEPLRSHLLSNQTHHTWDGTAPLLFDLYNQILCMGGQLNTLDQITIQLCTCCFLLECENGSGTPFFKNCTHLKATNLINYYFCTWGPSPARRSLARAQPEGK